MVLLKNPQLQGNQKQKQCRREEQVQIVLKLITLEKRLKSNSSQEPRASGKPDAVFSSRSDEPGNQFESSMFKYADLSNMGRSLLEGDKDQLLSQARSELMKQEHQVGSFNRCLNELQQQAYAQGLELQDA